MTNKLPEFSPEDLPPSFNSVLFQILENFTVDLAQYCYHLSPSYLEALADPPRGVYFQNDIEPLLNFDNESYFTYPQYHLDKGFPDVFTLDHLKGYTGTVLNGIGHAVFQTNPYTFNFCRETPHFNRSAIRLLFIQVFEYFNYLNRMAKPSTNVPFRWLNKNEYLKPEYHKYNDTYVFDEFDQPGYHRLIEQIQGFIKNDTFHTYHLTLSNSTLSIQKGNDFRVLEYYRLIYQHMEEVRQYD